MTYNKIYINKKEEEVKNFPIKMAFLMVTAVITIAINVIIFSGPENPQPVVDTDQHKVEMIDQKNV